MKRIITVYAPREPGGGIHTTDVDAALKRPYWLQEPDILVQLEVDLETRTTTVLKNSYTGEGKSRGA